MIREWFSSIAIFPIEWLNSRRLVHGMAALPGAIFGALLIIFAMSHRSASARIELAETYEKKAALAGSVKNFREQELYYRRAIPLSNHHMAARFQHALSLLQLRQSRRAIGIMRQLAPADRSGFQPAHRFLAELLLESQPNATVLVHHLLHGLTNSAADHSLRIELAKRLAIQEEFEQAAAHVAIVAETSPIENLMLGQLLNKANQQNEAATAFRKCEAFLRKKLSLDAGDLQARLLLAQVLNFQNRFSKAVDTLGLGLSHHHDQSDAKKTIRSALTNTWFNWFDQLSADLVDQRLLCLENAISLGSDSSKVLARVSDRILEVGLSDKTKPLEIQLEQSFESGDVPKAVCVLLGSAAARDGKPGTAVVWFDQARQQSANDAFVLNNFAWTLSELCGDSKLLSSVETDQLSAELRELFVNADQSPESILEFAKLQSDRAIAAAPDVAGYRETRGQILAKLELWAECIEDLETALRMGHDTVAVQTTLTTAYEKQGLHRGPQELEDESN